MEQNELMKGFIVSMNSGVVTSGDTRVVDTSLILRDGDGGIGMAKYTLCVKTDEDEVKVRDIQNNVLCAMMDQVPIRLVSLGSDGFSIQAQTKHVVININTVDWSFV